MHSRSGTSLRRLVLLALTAATIAAGAPRTASGAQGITFPPNGENPQASVMQAIGPVRVSIDYSSPRVVRGKTDRRGKIWGELVPWGLSDLGLNGCTECPWRGGANENTVFETTHDVRVQGEPLPAGRYGLHLIPGQDDWTVVFSKDADSWGSYWYDPKKDALRVKTKAAKNDYHEWLTYEFVERNPADATVALEWEDLRIPFKVSVDRVDDLWAADMRRDLRGWAGFSWQNWQQAAEFCAQKGVNLPEALTWAQRAVNDPYSGGEENFATLMTLSHLQELNGQKTESSKTFEKAINHRTASPVQIHLVGRQYLTEGKTDEALRIFQVNAKRYPNEWPVHVGLMRGYAAKGDNKKALAEARLAVGQAPDDANRKNLEGLVKKLEAGQSIN
jgi:Tfp pilus assembly protein PilF